MRHAVIDDVPRAGFPLAIHSVLYLDTMYWRNPWRASPKGIMTSLPPLASLCSALCCIRGRSGLRHNIASTFGRANSSGGDAVVGQKDALEPRLSDNRVADHTASTALLADSGRSSAWDLPPPPNRAVVHDVTLLLASAAFPLAASPSGKFVALLHAPPWGGGSVGTEGGFVALMLK
jgi:hypothetical protein